MLTTFDFGVNIDEEEWGVLHNKLRSFVSGHEKMLMDIQQTFNRRWDPTVWDAHSDTVFLQLGAEALRHLLEKDPPEEEDDEFSTSIADVLGRTQIQNRLFYRITLCFADLALKMESLTKEANDLLLPPLAMFDDNNCRDGCAEETEDEETDGITDEEALRGAGRMLGVLQKVWRWLRRVQKVVCHVVQQLASLYSPQHKCENYRSFSRVRYLLIWRKLADLLGAVVCVEEVLYSHDTLRYGLSIYRKLLAQVSRNLEKFECDEEKLDLFCHLLTKIDKELLDDGILKRITGQAFETGFVATADEPPLVVTTNKRLYEEFTDVLIQFITSAEGTIGTMRGYDERERYVGVLGLYYMYLRLFSSVAEESHRRDICNRIFALYRKIPIVYIRGMHCFRTALWFIRRLNAELKRFHLDAVKERTLLVKQECQNSKLAFLPQMNRFTTLVSVWLAEMESTAAAANHSQHGEFLQTVALVLQRGVFLAHNVRRLIVYHVALHDCADDALSVHDVDGISQGVQMLMMIRAAYHDKTGVIAASYNVLVGHIKYVMEQHLYDMCLGMSKIPQRNSTAETKDQYSAICMALDLLRKPQTPENVMCIDLVLSVVFHRQKTNGTSSTAALTAEHGGGTLIAFSQLGRIASYQKSIQDATNCEFLYWQREVFFPTFIKRLYQKPLNSEYMPYTILAMHDCVPSILSSRHTKSARSLLDAYTSYTWGCIREHLIEPLCVDIENDLRLCTHSVVLGQPFRQIGASTRARDMARFTRLPPICLFSEWLHIATEVEKHLDEKFYNLNALMANDWKTYEEIRNLALQRYGLRICDGYLPGSIVDQGLDVLVITENIQVFVANYTYNMNEQLFVQRPSTTESKHLHTLHIRHIANSIRTHGTGIMNTTVNYVYKCLLKKLAILSQFLCDDHVKSRLLKNAKLLHHKKEERSVEYTLAWAEKFIREMHKLGVADDGQTFLSKFRHLVSEIGNALAYMRMMRSGGLRAVADSAAFVPFVDADVSLERFVIPESDEENEGNGDNKSNDTDGNCEKGSDSGECRKSREKVPQCTTQAVQVVDGVIGSMREKLSDGSAYFRMLLEAVTKRLKGAVKYTHLKNFYLIVPPICVLHVETMIREKEQLVKKNKDGIFTDDGFALGCSFLLKLFGVWNLFDSLHWFENIRKHYGSHLQEVREGIARHEQKMKASKNAAVCWEEEVNNMHLTSMMLECSLGEYTALEEAFVSSKVFFYFATPEDASGELQDDDKDESEEGTDADEG
ncbi:hypothetical protein, conserved [Trypanosoma brucei gambiense DAL972]|uniref:WASH complex subunit 7 n=1 Tax=Trypanosoma brucei gambiense (strain MHOM/CI/86/DAL972) TaxID=679716 RepID=D0A798_TRYB9|nr:hypothetical protein, conserved [Trypanosoma brucei gambiense DAL972]CBH17549.1 hypothetical protein, conserved [Trypanosoma brucei gambiense DAL972]|eukprot:XP_011779813.1 hypothetical protein, conserved [Trypanosoma brucei gambiense DAL972]